MSISSMNKKKEHKSIDSLTYGEYLCVLCHHTFNGIPNDAQPVHKGICCDECYKEIVVPAILKRKYW